LKMSGGVVADLLDEGAWAITENLRVRRRSERLAGEVRELLLTYWSHRLCTISGSSARVEGLTTVRRLLRSAPGEALCDSCLAFACAVSLIEMREATEVLLHTEPQFQRAATCASCRRTVPSIIYK
jgi:hypothetical protein